MSADVSNASVGADRTLPMAGVLFEACQQVQRVLIRNEPRNAAAKYEIGCIIRDVRSDNGKYGEGSVGKIARAVGRDVDTLYQYADVAETWAQKEFERLIERKTTLGVPLSFSHFIELARVRRNRDLLKVLTERTFQGISVRHLRSLIGEGNKRAAADGDGDEVTQLAVLTRFGKRLGGLLDAAGLVDETLTGLRQIASSPKLAQLLVRMVDMHTQVQGALEHSLESLAAECRRVQAEVEAAEREAAELEEDTDLGGAELEDAEPDDRDDGAATPDAVAVRPAADLLVAARA
jgi:hypothetical protein